MSELGDLSRELIFKRPRPRPVRVEVPEWDGAVYVRHLTALERAEFEQSHQAKISKGESANFYGWLAAFCACDCEGRRLFSDADAVDLGECEAAAVSRIAERAIVLNRMGASAVEETRKN